MASGHVTRAGTTRELHAHDAADFARAVLLDRSRRLPVVAVTARGGEPVPDVDPDELATRLAGSAIVVFLRTGDATWALTQALPDGLDVYGGACRIWWPGLTEESSRRDHPLLFVWAPDQAASVQQRIVDLVGEASARRTGARMVGHVDRVEGGQVIVRAGHERGPVTLSDAPLPVLAAAVREGLELPVARVGRGPDGRPTFSVAGLLPTAWQRVAAECAMGDVVTARVKSLSDRYALVEILPGAIVVVPVPEIDWDRVDHPADVLTVGEIVPVALLDLEPGHKRAKGSIRHGRRAAQPRELCLIPGGHPFTAPAVPEAPAIDAALERALRRRIDELESELGALSKDRAGVLEELRETRRQAEDLRRALREAQASPSRGSSDASEAPSSERAFLRAVRVAHARAVDEDDREAHPLQRMRVGRQFLETLRSLEGIAVEKVIEVCAQVACQRAHRIPAREVHPLREGIGGSAARVRARDGARAWRCSMQDGTPSARRLHWWDVPGARGRTIEFASVGLHDEVEIPE